MAIEVKVPTLGESVTEATIGEWLKKPGEPVKLDEPIASLETDKVAVEVNAPAAGTMGDYKAQQGDTVEVGAVIAMVEDGTSATGGSAQPRENEASGQSDSGSVGEPATSGDEGSAAPGKPAQPAAPAALDGAAKDTNKTAADMEQSTGNSGMDAGNVAALGMSPAVRRLVLEHGIDPTKVKGTGKDGRLTREDVLDAANAGTAKATGDLAAASASATPAGSTTAPARGEERVKMTRLRQTIAKRLKEAQNTAALLTTFNDVDMTAVNETRERYKDMFVQKHGVKLGFMSFFTKAACLALKEIPGVNAQIVGDEIVYYDYVDMSVAVSGPNGLVVPVVRNADKLSFAEIEKTIAGLGKKAKDGTMTMDDMKGGTFTISNGGIFGGLMSTPIINPPQSAVLGLHRIEDRAVVRNGEIVIRPMMYMALSYDHRLIDGREAVTALKIIKEAIEDPARLLIDL